MDNERENTFRNYGIEISIYKCLTEFRKPLINTIISSLNLPAGSTGLDAGCGIGSITASLARAIEEKGRVTGLDLSEDLIRYAKINHQQHNLKFTVGNINSMPFNDSTFDWIWSMDTVWPGLKGDGCPAEDPATILQEFYRVIKPGGAIYLLFWSSQKFLPGYPMLEARLNTTSSATAPFREEMNPLNHMMNGRCWLNNAGFQNIVTKTYTGDIIAPLTTNEQNALNVFFRMLWDDAESEADQEDWETFMDLCDRDSDKFILNNPHYYGFYTYTLFHGEK
ncbi:MAG: methyltransferase domain-containing protein [Bacteroidales bacterium]|nr:methyltransferase domain-containing protein [Bacteroidales bacterium]